MSLFCDKYRPKKLSELDYNCEQAAQLKRLVSTPSFPHISIFGPSGSGKKTRVNSLLFELFDLSASKLRIESKIFEAPSGKKIEQRYVTSNYHLEVNPSENGFYDRVVIQELIKDVATSHSLSKKHPFKVVVIIEADRLTREAQQGLRRTLEKYVTTCRVILVGERISKLIPALKSRCLTVRNSAPSEADIRIILERIAKAESIEMKSNFGTVLDQIIQSSDRNLRRALLMLQSYACTLRSTKTGPILSLQWQDKINHLAKKLTESQSVKMIPEIRTILYELQTHVVPPELILRVLTNRLMNSCLDNQMRANLVRMAAIVDHRIAIGSKPIVHLELFAVNYMAMFRCSVENVASGLDDTMDFD